MAHNTYYAVLKINLIDNDDDSDSKKIRHLPDCELISLSSSHIEATEHMMREISRGPEQNTYHIITNDRVEITVRSFGYVYNSRKLVTVYKIQKYVDKPIDLTKSIAG